MVSSRISAIDSITCAIIFLGHASWLHIAIVLSWLSKLTYRQVQQKIATKKSACGCVSENSGTPKSSILMGFSIINHPFWGIPIFGNTHVSMHPHSQTTACLRQNAPRTHAIASRSILAKLTMAILRQVPTLHILGINSPFMGNHFKKGMWTHKPPLFRLMSVSLTPWKMNMEPSESTPGKGKSSSKPSFSGFMLIFAAYQSKTKYGSWSTPYVTCFSSMLEYQEKGNSENRMQSQTKSCLRFAPDAWKM